MGIEVQDVHDLQRILLDIQETYLTDGLADKIEEIHQTKLIPFNINEISPNNEELNKISERNPIQEEKPESEKVQERTEKKERNQKKPWDRVGNFKF